MLEIKFRPRRGDGKQGRREVDQYKRQVLHDLSYEDVRSMWGPSGDIVQDCNALSSLSSFSLVCANDVIISSESNHCDWRNGG